MNDNKFWVLIWGLILIAIVAIVGSISLYNYHDDKLFVNHDYEQVMLNGTSTYHWQKVTSHTNK